MPSVQGVISNLFWKGAAKSWSDRVTYIRLAQLRTNFLPKNNGPRKPDMFYITFDYFHLNQA